MAALMLGAVGVNGQAVMAQSTTGVVITRSGSTILNLAFSPSDPVLSLLLKSATELHETLGDGVKSYVIFLNNLLKFVNFKNVHQLILKLLVFEARLQNCFTSSTCDCVLTDNIVCNVIQTFFRTRFTLVVSDTLSKVVFEWICKLPTILDVSSYLNNFAILCLKFSPFPLVASAIQNGILLKGIHPRKLPANVGHCLLKVYYYPLSITPEVGEFEIDILEIIGQSNTNSLNTLFVTNIFIQERTLFLLNRRNIFVMHSVCSDLVKFLFDQNLSSTELVVEYRYVHELIWISMEGVYQLLLKAPNTVIATEYSNSILDCLRMLNFCFKQTSCVILAGGTFEKALANKMFVLNKGIGPKLPPLVNRKQTLSRVTDVSEPDSLRHINIGTLEGMDSEVLEMVSGALLLTQLPQNKSDHLEPLVLKLTILSKALNTLIRILKVDGVIIKQNKLGNL